MRKKLKMLFLTVMLLFLMGITVQAAVTEDGEFEYTGLSDDTVIITKYLGNNTDIIIPDEIEGRPVTQISSFINNDDSIASIASITGNNITSIGNSAFATCRNLKSVSFPNAVTIGPDCFRNCYSLTEAYLPKAFSIYSDAFYNCTNLKNISLPCLVTMYRNTFYNCSSLEEINLPKVSTIESNAFENCVNLKNIYLPRIRRIQSAAFKNCRSLSEFIFPESILEIWGDAFLNCVDLKSVTFPKNIYNLNQSVGSHCLGYSYETFYEKIPDFQINCEEGSAWYKYGVQNGFIIHSHAYTERITKEPTCTEDGEKTFTCSCGDSYKTPISAKGHDYSISTVVQKPTCSKMGIMKHLCSCGASYAENISKSEHDFSENKVVKKPTCREMGILEIKCEQCSYTSRIRLKKLTPPSKGSRLNDTKNKIIYKVTKAGLSGGTVSVVRYYGTSSSVTIPDKVSFDAVSYSITKLEANAFYNKDKIKKVTIGRNVSYIGSKCFYGCKKLKSLIIKTTKLTTKNVGSNSFKGIYSKAVVTIPAKKRSSYPKIFNTKGMPVTVKYKTS